MHYLGPSRTLVVSGTAAQRAHRQGEACAREYARAASSIGSIVVSPGRVGARVHTRLSQAGLLGAGAWYLRVHRPALKGHRGGKFWEAQHALAEGASIPAPLMFGLGAVPEIVGAQLGYTLGCTAVTLAPEVCAAGAPLVAYNHDFPPRFGEYAFVRKNRPTDGHASVCLTYPIMVGCLAGVNERGLAVTLNHAFCIDHGSEPGLLLTSLVQDCLDTCGTVSEAIALLARSPVTNGAILTLADTSGERVVVERSVTDVRVRRVDAPVAASFNKFRSPDMERVEIPLGAVSTGLIAGVPLHASNVERERRWQELLATLPPVFDDASIRALMSDHRGAQSGDSNTVCRHEDPLSETLWSAILDPAGRSLRAVFGHACAGDYRSFSID